VAGPLDFTTASRLRRTLADAQLNARLLMLDLRELTFIDGAAVRVIIDAAGRARHRGGRLMLARGPEQVDRVFTLTGACDQVMIFDLDPAEPSEVLQLGRSTPSPPGRRPGQRGGAPPCLQVAGQA
jgi:anti-anti-sigma factor